MYGSTREGRPSDTPVWPREAVPAAGIAGPVIVESYDSTVVIPPGAFARRDALDNLEITRP